jgi:hypothetical protein
MSSRHSTKSGKRISDSRGHSFLAVVDLETRATVRPSTTGICRSTAGGLSDHILGSRDARGEGRIQLDGPTLAWLIEAVASSDTTVLDLSMEIAVLAGTLQSDRVRDPADRIIVATAMHHRLPLVTKDGDIRAAALVETIW